MATESSLHDIYLEGISDALSKTAGWPKGTSLASKQEFMDDFRKVWKMRGNFSKHLEDLSLKHRYAINDLWNPIHDYTAGMKVKKNNLILQIQDKLDVARHYKENTNKRLRTSIEDAKNGEYV